MLVVYRAFCIEKGENRLDFEFYHSFATNELYDGKDRVIIVMKEGEWRKRLYD